MYIKIGVCGVFHQTWEYGLYAGNHRPMMWTFKQYSQPRYARRAAKKMAMKLNIKYREN